MKSVLVLYYSHGGHTARIARRIWETIIAEGHKADLMGIVEADREGVDWNKYDTVIIGCAVIYGKMNRELVAFVNRFKAVLDAKATASSRCRSSPVQRQSAPEGNPTRASSSKTTPGSLRTHTALPVRSTTRTGAGSIPRPFR